MAKITKKNFVKPLGSLTFWAPLKSKLTILEEGLKEMLL